MTNLTNLSPAASYGDLITCNNNGGGLTGTLQNIQDGLGNNSAIQLSTTTFNVTGAFQVSGVAFTPVVQNTAGTLSNAQLAAMNAASITVIPTPGAGFMTVIESFVVELIHATTLTGGGNVYLQYGTGAANTNYATPSAGVPQAFMFGTVNAAISAVGQINSTTGLATSVAGNAAINITNSGGAFTGGPSSINYYITYITVPIS